MTKEHFKRKENHPNCTTIIANCRGGVEMDLDRVIKELNDLETTRKRKGEKISDLKNRESLYLDIIYGIKAYLKLKSTEWL